MPRHGVQFSEVANVAHNLLSQGKNPTIEQVRRQLGTGSSTTIARHLKIWRDQQQGVDLQAAKEHIPAELITLMKELWQRMIHVAGSHQPATPGATNGNGIDKEKELEKYKSNNHRWQQMYTQWQQEKQQLLQQLSIANQEKIKLNQHTNILADKNTALHQSLDHLAAESKLLQAKLNDMSQQLAVAKTRK